MKRIVDLHVVPALISIVLTCHVTAGERKWPLDQLQHAELSIKGGGIAVVPGVHKKSLAFDGDSLLQVKDSSAFTQHESGFSFSVWVNPYSTNIGQQMIAAKNRYSLNQRQWAVMIDKDNRFRLYVWQGRWATVDCAAPPQPGRWHLVGVVVRPVSAELWVNGKLAGKVKLTKPIPQTKAPLTFGGVDDNGRIRQNFFGALDEIRLLDKPLEAKQMAASYKPVEAMHKIPAPPQPFKLWTGPPIPTDVTKIPFVKGLVHRTIHRASKDGYKFLHGAAIVQHKGVMYANWANSPTNENGPHETLRGRRSTDGGVTWSKLEVIAPGFEGKERRSHGVLFVHKGRLWTICARFGVGAPGRRFPGLQAEAFVLDEKTDRWVSRGVVMKNCWPCDQPVRMANGNYITGGQDKDGLPVIAISHGDDLTQWDSVLIPYDRRLKPSFAETTVWSEGDRVIAVIRGGGGVAWASTSDDYGRTWSKAGPSNLPMPRAKAYLGKLSTGQLYLLSNLGNRDTLCVSVSRPGETALSRIWRIRHGKSEPPRFSGAAKGKQWSYPYGYAHNGKLYVVYSIGKEDCGLSVIPVASLTVGIEPREKYLLLDQRLISHVDNAELRLGLVTKHPANPLLKDELPWEIDGSHMYLNVLVDPDDELYKCWYYSHITDWGKHVEPGPLAATERNGRGNCATLYATSKDGIHWEKPKLTAYLYKGKPTNIVNWRDHGVGVFKDPRDPNPERRYKMFCTGRAPGGRVHVAFSPDGIRWTKLIDTKISTSADTHNNAFWDPLAEEYVGITRAFSHGQMGHDLKGGIPWVGGFVIGQRVVARSTSKDFVKWSEPEIVFEYGHDKRQVYAMPSFYAHGVFLGLPVIYDNAGAYREDLAKAEGWSQQEVTPELESELRNAGRSNRMWPGLSWSPDTKDWRWVGRRGEALIPLSEDRKSIDWGCIFAAATPIVLDDEIRIYYSAQPGKHGWNPGHLCLATLRLDGWAAYEPKDDSKEAVVETRPVVCSGQTLSLAADAQDGSITVTVQDAEGNTLAESKPLTGSRPYTTVKWKNGFTLSSHKGQTIRLSFWIKQAKLYSFKFGK